MNGIVASVICEAIRRRLLLEFQYDGHPRLVAPYCHGISTRGNESMRAVQIGGAPVQAGARFGKLWTISKMSDVRLTEVSFIPDDPHYNPNDSAMKQIHCCI